VEKAEGEQRELLSVGEVSRHSRDSFLGTNTNQQISDTF